MKMATQDQDQDQDHEEEMNENEEEANNSVTEEDIAPPTSSTISENDPNFSAICSFFLKFGTSLGVTYSIQELKDMIEDSNQINEELIDLHIKLLRKRRKYINKDKWERALVKFCAEYSNVDAWELERYGYKNSKISIKLELLKRLLEAQFDYNPKFKLEVNANEAASLRILPIGRDCKGNMYWHQVDSQLNFRIYREELDDDKSWELVCMNKEQLESLIATLGTSSTLIESKEESIESDTNEDSNQAKSIVSVKEEGSESNLLEDKSESKPLSSQNMNHNSCEIKNIVKIEQPDDITVNSSSHLLQNGIDSFNIKSEIKPDLNESSIKSVSSLLSSSLISSDIDLKREQVTSPVAAIGESAKHDNDVSVLVDELVGKISAEMVSKNYVQSFSENSKDILSIEQGVSIICDYLVDEVCRLEEQEESEQKGDPSLEVIVNAIRGRGGRGRPRGRGRGCARGRARGGACATSRNKSESNEVCVPSVFKATSSSFAPVIKRSRRIQELHEKKMAELAEQMKREQERLEMLAKQRANDELVNGKKQFKSDDESEPPSSVEEDDDSDEDAEECKKEKKRKKRKKLGSKPWEVAESSNDSPSDSPEDEHEDEDEDEELKFDNDEDEFACEELDPDDVPIVIRRARTVRKLKSDSEEDSDEEPSSGSEVENDDKPCGKCGKYDHPEWILLCDKCDDGFHTACLRPPLMIIPDGDWFCPPCEHKMLCERLQVELSEISVALAKKEREDLRQQRLKFVAISVDNILKPKSKPETKKSGDSTAQNKSKHEETNGVASNEDASNSDDDDDDDDDDNEDDEQHDDDSMESWEYDYRKPRSHRTRKAINYQFTEYDDMINSAILEEVEGEEEKSAGRGKDMANISMLLEKEEEEVKFNEENEGKEQRSGKHLDESIMGPDDEDETKVKVNDEQKESQEDLDEEDELAFTKQSKKQANKRSQRKKHRGLNDLDSPPDDDDSDDDFKGFSSATEIEEASEEEYSGDDGSATEVSEDSDYKYRRRSSRRAASSRSKKSKGKGKRGKRGYKRDEFVVTSDDSDVPRSAKHAKTRTRAAARKKISYCEETTTEESEEDYNWKSNSRRKRGKGSEGSDEEWGGKKSPISESKGNKRKLWAEDDDTDEDEEDDEEEEEKDEEEQEDEEEEEDDDDDDEEVKEKETKEIEKKPSKSKANSSVTARKFEMKGKPRMSKARLMSLREDSENDDSRDTTSRKKKGKKSKISDSDEEQESEDEDDNEEAHEKDVNPSTTIKLGKGDEIEGNTTSNELNARKDKAANNDSQVDNIHETSKVDVLPTQDNLTHPNINSTLSLPSSVPSSSSSNTPMLHESLQATQPPITTHPSVPASSMPPNHHPNQYESYPTNGKNNESELYNMDNYSNRPIPLKPTHIGDAAPYPHSSSPSRILTLDSNNSFPPHIRTNAPFDAFNSSHKPGYDPKMARNPAFIDPRMSAPFVGPPGQPMPPHVHPQLRADLNSPMPVSHPHSHPHDHVHASPYPPPHSGHARLSHVPPAYTFQPSPYLRHAPPPNPFRQEQFLPATQSPLARNMPMRNARPPSLTSTTRPSQTQAASRPPLHQSHNLSTPYRPASDVPVMYQQHVPPGNYFMPPHQANYYAPHSQASSGNMPLPPDYPPPYSQSHPQFPTHYYPHTAGPNASPNGGFMIHNLLQHRTPAPEGSSEPHAVSHPVQEDMNRSIAEFPPYMTQP